MKHTLIAAATAVAAMTSFSAGAQAPAPRPQLAMDSGFYLLGGAGRARSEFRCTTTCESRDTTWAAYAGYQFNRHFALEAGYGDLGKLTVSGNLGAVPVFTRFETTFVEVDAVALAPFTDTFSAFLKLGMYHYNTDAQQSGGVSNTSSAKGTEFTLGLGFQYMFTPNLGARLEWQRYNDVGTGAPGLESDAVTLWRLSGRFKF